MIGISRNGRGVYIMALRQPLHVHENSVYGVH